MRSRLAGAVVAVLAAVALAACDAGDDPEPTPQPTPEPTVAVADADDTYRPMMAHVVAEITEVSGRAAERNQPASIWYDGEHETCAYASVRYEFSTVFGEDVAWDEVRDAVAEVLEPEGFELTGQLDIPGGWNGFDAVAGDGARIEVRSKLGTPSSLELNAPVSGTCSHEDSETISPDPDQG